jgi:hypothetical protein
MIHCELEGIEKALKMFDRKPVISAAREAINRTSVAGRAEASKLIRTEYNVKAKELSAYLAIESRARDSSLEVVIRGRGRGIALAKFDAKQAVKSTITRKSGQTGVVIKGDGRHSGTSIRL